MDSAAARLEAWLEREQNFQLPFGPCAIHAVLVERALAASIKRSRAWYPHAGLMQILLWSDRFVDAAEFAELTIDVYRQQTDARNITNEDFPFNDALLAERKLDPTTSDARLKRLAQLVDPDSELGQRLNWLIINLPERPLHRLMSGYQGWDDPPEPLAPPYDELAPRIDSVRGNEIHDLWVGAYNVHNIEVGRGVAGRYGHDFPFWYVAAWFAAWQIKDGDIAGAQDSLRRGWDPDLQYAIWELLPVGPVLQDGLRPAMTPAFRQEWLVGLGSDLPWERRKRR